LLWEKKGMLDRALDDFDKTISKEERHADAYDHRGLVRYRSGDYEAAIRDYSHAIRLDPKNPMFHGMRAVARAELGDVDGVIADCDAALQLDKECRPAYKLRAISWRLKKEYGKAISDFEEALRRNPSDRRCLQEMAILLATCRDDKLRDGKRAVKLARQLFTGPVSWADPGCLATLAAAYAEAGDFEQAIKLQQKIVNEDLAPTLREAMKSRLALFKEHKPYRRK
jgi:tetratricopeptide (TPR) repeat protein